MNSLATSYVESEFGNSAVKNSSICFLGKKERAAAAPPERTDAVAFLFSLRMHAQRAIKYELETRTINRPGCISRLTTAFTMLDRTPQCNNE